MDKYTLYLDECNDKNKGLILVSGFAIPNNQLQDFNNSILDVKKLIWNEEYIKSKPTVLHCTELSLIYNNRRNPDLYQYINRHEYKLFIKMNHVKIKETYEQIYFKLCEIIKKFDITVFGCKIDENKFTYLYDNKYKRFVDDPYNIAIQVIIENFTHYLEAKNGVGYIIYESRNSENNVHRHSLDMRMFDNFCKIKVAGKGIPYACENSLTNRIRFFDIISKTTENAGLELADFITYSLFKSFFIGDDKDKSEFMKKIEQNTYNGNFNESDKNLKDFYGVRCIPEDYKTVNDLTRQLRSLKEANKKLKKENKKLLKKNALLKEEKEKLKKQTKNTESQSTDNL